MLYQINLELTVYKNSALFLCVNLLVFDDAARRLDSLTGQKHLGDRLHGSLGFSFESSGDAEQFLPGMQVVIVITRNKPF